MKWKFRVWCSELWPVFCCPCPAGEKWSLWSNFKFQNRILCKLLIFFFFSKGRKVKYLSHLWSIYLHLYQTCKYSIILFFEFRFQDNLKKSTFIFTNKTFHFFSVKFDSFCLKLRSLKIIRQNTSCHRRQLKKESEKNMWLLNYHPFHRTLPRSSAFVNWGYGKVLWNGLYRRIFNYSLFMIPYLNSVEMYTG